MTGVYELPHNRWRASGQINHKWIQIGIYDTPEEASIAYNIWVKATFGEFARER